MWAWVWKGAVTLQVVQYMDLRLLTSSRFPPIVGGCWFCPGRARGSGNWEGGERGMLLKIPAALDREREREREREGERGGEFPGLFKASFKSCHPEENFQYLWKARWPKLCLCCCWPCWTLWAATVRWGQGTLMWRKKRLLGVEEWLS